MHGLLTENEVKQNEWQKSEIRRLRSIRTNTFWQYLLLQELLLWQNGKWMIQCIISVINSQHIIFSPLIK